MKGHHKLVAALAAGALVTTGAPAVASAAPAKGSAAATKISAAQLNKRLSAARKDLRRYGRLISQLRRASGTTGNGVNNLRGQVNGLTTALAALDASLKGTQGTLAGVINIAGTALPALQNGLVTLGSAYQSVEYGVGGVTATNTLGSANLSALSPDVPDDGNTARAVGDGYIVAGAGNVVIDLKAEVRSAEGDNTATTPAGTGPVGQAGGLIQVTNVATGAAVACNANATPLGSIIGTVAGENIVTPSGTVNTLPLKNIANGKLRTDTTSPGAGSTSLLPATCTINPGPGTPIRVHYEVNFVDIPTTTTPGPRD